MFAYLAEMTPSNILLEILYFLMGLVALNTGIKNLRDEENPHRVGTFIFWGALALIFLVGKFLNANFTWGPLVTGILVIIMAAPAIIKKMGPGKSEAPSAEEMNKQFEKIGMKIFIPALCIGLFALCFALFTKLNALVGVGCGVLVGAILVMIFDKKNKPSTFINDSRRLLDMVGELSMLPMLLGALGAVFTAAGVGDVIAGYVGKVIPAGNVTIGIIVYCIAMPLFTIIMGNAFAAITVITVGIGGPFVLAYGANPVIVGMLALTCGYCGTLCTPMAANFNITPVAILEMKNKYGVIKRQIVPAVIILIFQICYMLIAA
ncbi:MAG: DUF979 domain-containing protein [Clostridiaceae bacterium]|nr:DUF979 domain-containing protein [Eubacteriales bacterium]